MKMKISKTIKGKLHRQYNPATKMHDLAFRPVTLIWCKVGEDWLGEVVYSDALDACADFGRAAVEAAILTGEPQGVTFHGEVPEHWVI